MNSKKLLVIIALVLVLILSGCAAPPKKPPKEGKLPTTPTSTPTLAPTPTPSPTPTTPFPAVYTGFPEVEEGAWAEYVIVSAAGEFHQKCKYIGTDTIEGKEAKGFEWEVTTTQGMKTIIQAWIDLEGNPIKYAMKILPQGTVFCLDVEKAKEMYAPPKTKTPDEFSPELEWKPGTYTTPTGKTVNVAIFVIDDVEHWVSSEVPFGLVKTVEKGQVKLKLYDFDFTGASREISKSELETCQPMQLPSIPSPG